MTVLNSAWHLNIPKCDFYHALHAFLARVDGLWYNEESQGQEGRNHPPGPNWDLVRGHPLCHGPRKYIWKALKTSILPDVRSPIIRVVIMLALLCVTVCCWRATLHTYVIQLTYKRNYNRPLPHSVVKRRYGVTLVVKFPKKMSNFQKISYGTL